MFSVCVLLFGDNVALAARCLNSITTSAAWDLIRDIRIGLNAVSDSTLSLVRAQAAKCKVPVYVYREINNRNVLKYPMMRRMLYDPVRPMRAEWVMWFDDDSYIYDHNPDWWRDVALVCECRNAALLGSVYRPTYQFSVKERAAIAKQPWYAGALMPASHKPQFCTGGWWVAKPSILATWDYPFPVICHNGGDVLLGELCRQQGYAISNYNSGVSINADAAGWESKAKRRGRTTPRPFEVEWPRKGAIYEHQEFDVEVMTLRQHRE